MDWYVIVSLVVGVIGATVGSLFAARWGQAVALLKELGEALLATGEALEDKELTKDEATKVLKEWQDVISAFLGKSS